MRKLLGPFLLFFLMAGVSLGQSIFTPDYAGNPSSHRTTEDSRINAVITNTMGTTTGYPPPSAYAGRSDRGIPASPNGYGDNIRGVNPPPAIGVEDNGQIRASNIVAKIRGQQNTAPSTKRQSPQQNQKR
jgi:hypothetical protein